MNAREWKKTRREIKRAGKLLNELLNEAMLATTWTGSGEPANVPLDFLSVLFLRRVVDDPIFRQSVRTKLAEWDAKTRELRGPARPVTGTTSYPYGHVVTLAERGRITCVQCGEEAERCLHVRHAGGVSFLYYCGRCWIVSNLNDGGRSPRDRAWGLR